MENIAIEFVYSESYGKYRHLYKIVSAFVTGRVVSFFSLERYRGLLMRYVIAGCVPHAEMELAQVVTLGLPVDLAHSICLAALGNGTDRPYLCLQLITDINIKYNSTITFK